MLWLTPNTLLLGRVDARGRTGDGHEFFGEWKSLSNYKGRYIDDEKLKWRTDPQALTYGVLLSGECSRFTVRWAIKPDDKGKHPPTCAFEWYSYTPTEVEHWRTQLIEIADEIRQWRLSPRRPWRTNFSNCYRYGIRYACPFVDDCNNQAWVRTITPRVPHLEIERKIKNELDKYPPDLVILDASRVDDYLACPQAYRRKWEGDGYSEESEALTVGKDFHAAIAAHITRLIQAKEKP